MEQDKLEIIEMNNNILCDDDSVVDIDTGKYLMSKREYIGYLAGCIDSDRANNDIFATGPSCVNSRAIGAITYVREYMRHKRL
jgi:hypothetical protein